MLNQKEFERGLADAFIKSADSLFLSSLPLIAKGLGKGIQAAHQGAEWLGSRSGDAADYLTRNPETATPNAPVQPSFLGGLRNSFNKGLNKTFIGSQGQIDLGNNILNKTTGGSIELDANNQAKINFGNAVKHFGGQAVDWIRNNPGRAMLGGGALLGGGMLLHNALSNNDSPTPEQQPQPQAVPQRRFAFAKPGITG